MEQPTVNPEVAKTMNSKLVEVKALIIERQNEIARLDALAPAARIAGGKAKYEAINPSDAIAMDAAASANAGELSKTGVEAKITKGLIRKVEVPKGEKPVSALGDINKKIKACFASMEQAALAQQPNKKVSTGSKGDGSHAITKAWFEKNKDKCPEGMSVSWNDATNKIEYNLPKGGRGATVSHGALNNILKAFGGRVGANPEPAPVAEPKKVPEKVSPKKAAKK